MSETEAAPVSVSPIASSPREPTSDVDNLYLSPVISDAQPIDDSPSPVAPVVQTGLIYAGTAHRSYRILPQERVNDDNVTPTRPEGMEYITFAVEKVALNIAFHRKIYFRNDQDISFLTPVGYPVLFRAPEHTAPCGVIPLKLDFMGVATVMNPSLEATNAEASTLSTPINIRTPSAGAIEIKARKDPPPLVRSMLDSHSNTVEKSTKQIPTQTPQSALDWFESRKQVTLTPSILEDDYEWNPTMDEFPEKTSRRNPNKSPLPARWTGDPDSYSSFEKYTFDLIEYEKNECHNEESRRLAGCNSPLPAIENAMDRKELLCSCLVVGCRGRFQNQTELNIHMQEYHFKYQDLAKVDEMKYKAIGLKPLDKVCNSGLACTSQCLYCGKPFHQGIEREWHEKECLMA